MSKLLSRYAIMFAVLMALQLLVLNNINLGGYINPYIYILFIMLLPFETPGWILLIFGFLTGLTIDAFSGTLGLHSSATLFIAFIRPTVLSSISTHDSVDRKGSPSLVINDIGWFIKYTLILVLIHHFILFYLETFTFVHFFFTLFRVMLSTIITSIFILLSQLFFFNK